METHRFGSLSITHNTILQNLIHRSLPALSEQLALLSRRNRRFPQGSFQMVQRTLAVNRTQHSGPGIRHQSVASLLDFGQICAVRLVALLVVVAQKPGFLSTMYAVGLRSDSFDLPEGPIDAIAGPDSINGINHQTPLLWCMSIRREAG